MGNNDISRSSISWPLPLKQQVELRVTKAPLAEDRSSVLTRDLERYYGGLLKQGLKDLRKVNLSLEERACIGTLLSNTVFMTPSHITHLLHSLEDAQDEMHAFGVDPTTLLEKMHTLDLVALYALVDLIERDPTLNEIA